MAKIGPKFGGLPWDFQAEYQKSVLPDLISFKRKSTPKMERICEKTAERYFRKHGHILKWPTLTLVTTGLISQKLINPF
jgi:hypothetical protein